MRNENLISVIVVIGMLCAAVGFGYFTSLEAANPRAERPENIFALQGLRGNTLVAGKITVLRIFTDQSTYDSANRIEATILRPDGIRLVKSWLRSDFVEIPNSTRGPSLVVRIPGTEIPWIGMYHFDVNVLNSQGGLLASYSLDQTQLLPTKDLLVGIDRLWAGSVNPGTPQEIQAADDAMRRLAGILPIRDGVSTLDGDRTAGLRYVINNAPIGPPNQDGQLCPFFASKLNRPEGSDSISVGVAYRFQDPGEPCGGTGSHSCSGQSLLWAFPVCNAPLGAPFGQELGHTWGLEPAEDPHWDPNVQAGHSKDARIDQLDAELGFDCQLNRPFANPLFDNMHQAICGCANDSTAYNSWDWEYSRKQFLKFSSTGPTPPPQFSTDVTPAVAGVGNNVYFFAKRLDGRIYYNRAELGQAGQGWAEMEGDGISSSAPAAAAVGNHVFVAIRLQDGHVAINQADLGQSFGEWFPSDFTTDVAPAVAGVGNNVYFFAKRSDGRIFYNRAELGKAGQGWVEMEGNGISSSAPAAAAVGNHVFVAIRLQDGHVAINQADLGQSFGEWFPSDFTTDVAPAVAGVGNNVYFFAKRSDGRIFYNRAELGKAGQGWVEIEGNGISSSAPAAAAVGNHVFVAIREQDGRVAINQADLGHSFGEWFP